MSSYIKHLIAQVRAVDTYGMWEKISDEALIKQKFVKTKEELKALPTIADIDEMQVKEIKMLYSALAIAFEEETKEMASVVMEMSHEGFGRCIVYSDKIVIAEKYFKDAHRFCFPSVEKLVEDMEKMTQKAVATYRQYLPCKNS